MGQLSAELFNRYKIVTTGVSIPAPDGPDGTHVSGIRVTPSIYTLPRELDVFIEAVSRIVAEGRPT
jgi:hypothetical protein